MAGRKWHKPKSAEISTLENARERLYSQRASASTELIKLNTRLPDAERERYLADPPPTAEAPAVIASDELRERSAAPSAPSNARRTNSKRN
jgi:hypothetical protein